MARADLLKQLFRAYRESDRESFMDVARSIAGEERKKHHPALANELLRVLNNEVVAATPSHRGTSSRLRETTKRERHSSKSDILTDTFAN